MMNGFMNGWHTIQVIGVNNSFYWTQMIGNNGKRKHETNQQGNTISTYSHEHETFSSFRLTVFMLISGSVAFFLPQLFALFFLFLPEVCSFTIL